LKFGDRWQQKANTAEALRSVGWSFILLKGDFKEYRNHKTAFVEFCRKVDLLIEQNSQRVSALLSQQSAQQHQPSPDHMGNGATRQAEVVADDRANKTAPASQPSGDAKKD